jgi:hypoxanthine phosphoribosyltransferase
MDFSKKYDISVYLTEEQLNKRIAEIGAQITEKYRGQSVYLICILKGSIFFTTELAKRIDLPMTMDFMSVSSYGSGTESSGDVKIKKDLEHSIEGENVIIIEDIIDSGNTLSRLSKLLAKRNPKSLTICTLLDKPERRVVDDDESDPGTAQGTSAGSGTAQAGTTESTHRTTGGTRYGGEKEGGSLGYETASLSPHA